MAEQSVKKAPAKKSDKKPGFFAKASQFFREMKAESKKVVWPSKKQIINNTGIVIAVVVACSVVIGGFDYLLNLLIGLLAR